MATQTKPPAPEGAAPSELPQPTPEVDPDGFIHQETASRDQGKGPFLVGRSDVGTERRVTESDFAGVGIAQETITFDWKNGFRVPLSSVSKEAADYLVEKEYGFSISDE